jgi:DNA primase
MPLFPQQFLDDLRLQADIVQVVQDYVSLRRVGSTYKGLCPFHGEKTPSFSVDRERGFFHCFGCGVGGNVFKFVELQEKVSFPDAVRLVAQKFGVSLPEPERGGEPAANAEREALLKAHEIAADLYQRLLRSPAGRRGRDLLLARGLQEATIERLGLGFAPSSRETLATELRKRGIPPAFALKSGLVVDRGGRVVDRFWGRLMIPICREGGSVVAFGGRAMEPEQQPKYLNSPETPVYSKGRTVYGLHVTRHDIRRQGYAVLVEGYFDFAQAWQAGITTVAATCGTALTQSQAQVLRRFASRAILSFDPDAAGQNAAVRSCDLLVREGFDVGVALLPRGQDPDVFVRHEGAQAYQALIDKASPYLDFLLNRAAARHELSDPRGRLAFLNEMLAVAAGIPEAAARDQFADRLAHRAGVAEEVVRQEIRRAAVARRPTVPERRLPGLGELTLAEKDLLAGLMGQPEAAFDALDGLESDDLVGLAARPLLEAALALKSERTAVPSTLLERLTEEEAALLTGIAARASRPAPAADCVRALRVRRFERERAEVQRQIDRLQEEGLASGSEIDRLLARKYQLHSQIEALS